MNGHAASVEKFFNCLKQEYVACNNPSEERSCIDALSRDVMKTTNQLELQFCKFVPNTSFNVDDCLDQEFGYRLQLCKENFVDIQFSLCVLVANTNRFEHVVRYHFRMH